MTIERCIFFAAVLMLSACSREPTYRTVSDFVDDPALLEAALVRCTENRSESRYEAECVNAREAVKLIEARDESQRRAEREAQSQRKREALRRTQQAAAEARRRALEEARLREEAAYQAQFGAVPADDSAGPVQTPPDATAGDGDASIDGDEPADPPPDDAPDYAPDDGQGERRDDP